MPHFDTYIQLQSHLAKELSKREGEIDNVLYYWLTKSREAEMFYKTDKDFVAIDTTKAQKHFKLVELYNILFGNQLVFKATRNPYDFQQKPISPKANAKRQKDIIKFNDKQELLKLRTECARENSSKMINELDINHTVDELKDDIHGSREIIKKLFQKIFPLYGIDLDDKFASIIFGTIEFKKQNHTVDTISLFTNNTSFLGSLGQQFYITQNGLPKGLFSAFFMRSAGLLHSYENQRNFDKPDEIKSSSTHNPFFKEKQALRILAMIYVMC